MGGSVEDESIPTPHGEFLYFNCPHCGKRMRLEASVNQAPQGAGDPLVDFLASLTNEERMWIEQARTDGVFDAYLKAKQDSGGGISRFPEKTFVKALRFLALHKPEPSFAYLRDMVRQHLGVDDFVRCVD